MCYCPLPVVINLTFIKYKEGEFIGELLEDEIDENSFNSNLLVGKQDTVLWKIEKDRFYSLLSDNVEFARKIIDQLQVA